MPCGIWTATYVSSGTRTGAVDLQPAPTPVTIMFIRQLLRSTAYVAVAFSCLVAAAACGTGAGGPPPGMDAIRTDQLRSDVEVLADDSMRGRDAGSVDELRAGAWLAARAREEGLEPAGEAGTYFQVFPIHRTRQTPRSRVVISGTPFEIWEEAVVVWAAEGSIDAPILFVGEGKAADLDTAPDIRGRVVAAVLSAPEDAPPLGPDLSPRRYAMLSVRERARFLTERGAAAVILVSDSVAGREYKNIAAGWAQGDWSLREGYEADRPPVIWVGPAALDLVKGGGQRPAHRLQAELTVERFVIPSANVIARVPGSDPSVAEEHVLFSAHHDHLGVRFAWEGDSIWNGADDNATACAALLAIGRAFKESPARRSALFVWHGAEERGLLGSYWHAENPVIPRESIVAVLNADMIGRSSPDSAALLGSVAPNLTSTALVQMGLAANAAVGGFALDSTWERAGHPENFFRRSDHWPYVQKRIPALYFTALLHDEYHTPFDEAEKIDWEKLTRITRWMYATGWDVADAAQRPTFERNANLNR
jgi:hypothetical protein